MLGLRKIFSGHCGALGVGSGTDALVRFSPACAAWASTRPSSAAAASKISFFARDSAFDGAPEVVEAVRGREENKRSDGQHHTYNTERERERERERENEKERERKRGNERE